jgi:hypothetical protein
LLARLGEKMLRVKTFKKHWLIYIDLIKQASEIGLRDSPYSDPRLGRAYLNGFDHALSSIASSELVVHKEIKYD